MSLDAEKFQISDISEIFNFTFYSSTDRCKKTDLTINEKSYGNIFFQNTVSGRNTNCYRFTEL